jgi:hypothetical protein
VTATANDMVSVLRAELDALRAENRRLRREAGDAEALRRIRPDSGDGRTFTREELAEAWELVSDRVLRFPDKVWDELEGLPQPFRSAQHRGRSSTCSMNQSRRWLTRFPRRTRCRVPSACTFRRMT